MSSCVLRNMSLTSTPVSSLRTSSRVSTILGHISPSLSLNTVANHSSSPSPSPSPSLSASFPIRYSSEVSHALRNNLPIVSLESTIITHGMPYPSNLSTALSVEESVRKEGAIPATIAVMEGVIRVGLEREEIEKLAKMGTTCVKCSRRDIAALMANKASGSTTVSATMLISHYAGIRIFATGGIGGVHRGVSETWDISADLTELGRTPVSVVCAGVKSILDFEKTLEVLETEGVSVITLGQKEFPAFFTRSSGVPSPLVASSHSEIAGIIHMAHRLGLSSSQLIAIPIPKEEAAKEEKVGAAINEALREMKEKGIKGRDVTPFLLKRVAEISGGESLEANIKLIHNNAKNAAIIAKALKRIEKQEKGTEQQSFSQIDSRNGAQGPVVIGGTNQDIIGSPLPSSSFLVGTSNPGTIIRHWGGVGRNIAECLARLRCSPHIITAIGEDEEGKRFINHSAQIGIDTRGVIILPPPVATSTYLAIMDKEGDLFTTIAQMDAIENLSIEQLTTNTHALPLIHSTPLLILDGNISSSLISFACHHASSHSIPVFFEPTSIEKSVRATDEWKRGRVHWISPSAAELLAMAEKVGYQATQRNEREERRKSKKNVGGKEKEKEDMEYYQQNSKASEQELIDQCSHLLRHIQWQQEGSNTSTSLRFAHIILKRGEKGVLLVSRYASSSSLSIQRFPARPLSSQQIVNTSGAGDTLVGCVCWKLLDLWEKEGRRGVVGEKAGHMNIAIPYGMRGAEATLQHAQSINPNITPEYLESRMQSS